MLMNGFVFLAVCVAVIATVAYLFVVLRTAAPSERYVDIQPFSGCYFAPDADVIVLGKQGSVSAGSKRAGTYSVLRPVPGKHGHLLELDATGFAEVNGRLVLDPDGRSQLLDITPAGIITVYSGEGKTQFRRGKCPDAQGPR